MTTGSEEAEVINYLEHSPMNDPLGWAVIMLITHGLGRIGEPKDFGDLDPKNIIVKCSINAVPVKFSVLVERLVEEFDRRVSEKAQETIKEKMFDIDDILDELRNAAIEAVGRIHRKELELK